MKIISKSISLILISCTLLCSVTVFAENNTQNVNVNSTFAKTDLISYNDYCSSVTENNAPETEVTIRAVDYSYKSDDMSLQAVADVKGTTGKANFLITGDRGTVSWKFNIAESGWYSVKVRYYQVESINDYVGKTSSAMRTLYIDGAIPYEECKNMVFERLWKDKIETAGKFSLNANGDMVRPSQVEAPEWADKWCKDPNGFITAPLRVFLKAGEHTLSLESLREPLMLDIITLGQPNEIPTYKGESSKLTNTEIIVQGEASSLKSEQTLVPFSDISSSAVEPYSLMNTVLNYIGGINWSNAGQWIEWEFDVEKSGYYCVDLKFKQKEKRGLYCSRSLYIDGEIPFKEVEIINFPYGSKWQMMRLADEQNEPYLFYLEKGKHTIRLQNTLGTVADIAKEVSKSAEVLSDVYRKVLMVVGNTPDTYRDYGIVKQFPELESIFANEAKNLQNQQDALAKHVGEKSSLTSILSKVIVQVNSLAEDPESISKKGNFDALKTNVGSLSSWVQEVSQQPLSIDYIRFCSPDLEKKSAERGFFIRLVDSIKQIAVTYIKDYNAISHTNTEKSITVWCGSGRDQANVLKTMIDDDFSVSSGIGVDLKLIDPETTLISAIMSGNAPDVAMGISKSTPVNYALRGAVADISNFEGFDEVSSQFRESAITPYRFNGGVYALPQTESYFMMFYRKDILEEMAISVPETWEDISNTVTVLQRYNLDIGLPEPTVLTSDLCYAMFLYQNNGEFYNSEGNSSNIFNDFGIAAFKKWTDYYTMMSFPINYDPASRFRRGEIPILIADYTFYNTLMASAPEISGKWAIAPVPGTYEADGITINRSVASNSTGCIMLEASNKKQEAWEYMVWWTGENAQLNYGREVESVLGSAARYTTANLAAQSKTSWTTDALESLLAQGKWVKGIPEVPGGYFTPRHLDNAFRYVTNNDANTQDTLKDYVGYINEEIEQKRKEFGLD